MKFTDGNWLHRKGVQAHYATEVYDAWQEGEELVLLVPTRPIRHRGDTLEGPVLAVRLAALAEDAIRVRIAHFEGVLDRGPNFELTATPPDPLIEISEETVRLSAGRLSAVVDRKRWELRFEAEGRTITRSPGRSAAYFSLDGKPHIQEGLALGVGELVYGLGERFTAFVKNGQTVDIWNEDGGTSSEQAYKNIPFYMTNRGYGVLANHPGRVSYEVASERVSRVHMSVPGESLEYVVIYGPTPKEVLRKYTALTGRPALPPAWSFGLWLSTSFTTDYDEATVTSFIQGMEDRGIPLSVFHFDCFWMRGFRWTDLVWDPNVFPDPKGLLDRLHARGLKVSVWINPYIAQASRLFAEGKEGGYLVRRPNGDVWQWDLWQPGMALVDFTNPDACAWFAGHLEALLDTGVDALKTDFGERIPTDVVYHDGSDPERMHNYYTQRYNQTVFELLERKRGKGEAILFARSATVGGQKFPVHWGGDCWSDFEAMAESLRGGLSLGLCGFGFWSHDIGGFEGLPPASLYKRWVQFGLLSSHSRLHGSSSYRVPWLYDDEAVDVLREFSLLKRRLMPYLYACAVEAHEEGVPMMRPMMFEFPDDPACHTLDRQYMLGSSLLVAPVFHESDVEFYVPEGTWTNLLTGETLCGQGWRKETHGFHTLPLLAKEGAIIPMSDSERFWEDVAFHVFGEPAPGTTPVFNADGELAAILETTQTDGAWVFRCDAKCWRIVQGSNVMEPIDNVVRWPVP